MLEARIKIKFKFGWIVFCGCWFIFGSCQNGNENRTKGKLSEVSGQGSPSENCIDRYRDSISLFSEYAELQSLFSCYYENAFDSHRQYYHCSLDSAFVDGCILFSYNRDTALLMYWVRLRFTDGTFYNQETDVFAYRNEAEQWRFTDHCNASIYPEDLYTFDEAVRDHRYRRTRGFFISNSCEMNNSYFADYCKNFCGPCRNSSAKHDPNSVLYQTFNPPDSLYDCQ